MAPDDRDLAAVKQEDISDASLVKARNPELNLDVVSCVMGFSNRLTLSSLMKTCHAYYSIGVPNLLRFPVEIGRFESMESFHAFIFSTTLGPPDRFQFLKDLTLSGGYHHPHSREVVFLSNFLHIISHSVYLECLSLESDGANFLFYTHHFPHGISALENLIALRKIVVCSWTSLDWLRRLRAPVAELTFYYANGAPPDLLSAISNFSKTLTTLDVHDIIFDSIDAGLQFPALHDLTIRKNLPNLRFGASTVFRLFPNLKLLHFPTDLDMNEDYQDLPDDDMHRDYHASLNEGVRDSNVMHKSLDELSGCATDLYRGAWRCRVKKLSVDLLDHISAQWLVPLLEWMRPSDVTLGFTVNVSGLNTIPSLSSILQRLSTIGKLDRLTLTLDLHKVESWVTETIIEDLSEALRDISTTRLIISCDPGYDAEDEDADNFEYLRVGVDWNEMMLGIVQVTRDVRIIEIKPVSTFGLFRYIHRSGESV